ncbi:hypothetical protein PC123_g24110 [Phytophthora cactorum]|nr:hypothetical protein PC123_g24110 [Phytophthora cactorum]
MLQWKPLNSENFAWTADSTSIAVQIPGLYAIAMLVNHWSTRNNSSGTILLLKDGVEIQRAATPGYDTHSPSFSSNIDD